ncbi:MAG: LacI family DNA-binding transcriptional regulator [Clostridia bacterium]
MAATIKDVAKYAGVSISTVSKYINGGRVREKNRQRIEEAIKALDFKVNELARGLKTNRTMTVGVLIPSLENIFFTSIISYMENILLKNRYSTIVCDYRNDVKLEKIKFEFLMDKMVDGIIMVPHEEDIQYINKAFEKNIPVVLIDRMIKGIECDVVLTDNLNASYNAVEQLIMRGHRRIGIICGPKDVYTTQERLKGYIRVHEDYSLQIDDRLIKFGNYDVESGYNLLLMLLEEVPPPSAVFVTNYEMTVGAVMAVNEKNICIPHDLSLIGFDNIQLAKVVKPSLSIVTQPIQQIGETAATILLKRMKGDYDKFPSVYRLKTQLLLGESICNI